ncbi:MAG: beta-phosphoglucomutase family hydrolase [Deltaproteobacteria bacterium]|nr:beta-phosphoglucomutase family hydrolase [Deltaproteobacteria bacterium]
MLFNPAFPHDEPLDLSVFSAVLFDLDGVLTATARVHSRCWEQMFDEFLTQYYAQHDLPFVPFDPARDYRDYVDGKPRVEGIRSFLASRGIELPWGNPDDAPDVASVYGLGNWKNAMFREVLEAEGVDVFEGSVRLARWLREQKVHLAVVSSSKNCMAILEKAGLVDLFDLFMDGNRARELDLAGKPAPDTFARAAHELHVPNGLAVVVEDAISGVQAGHAGNFGLVVGVDRHGDPQSLLQNGADVVVSDLAELLPEGSA